MNLFRFFEQQDFKINQTFLLNQANSHKIISVLRLQINSQIYLFNNTNYEFLAKIINIQSIKKIKHIEIEIITATYKNLESSLKIHLVQAIPKNDNMDLIVQKAIELGVHTITPILTKRTIIKITADKIINKTMHWQSIAIAACAQCGRNIVPIINNVLSFDDFIKIDRQSAENHNKFILSPNTNTKSNININMQQEIIIIIGPEGGFSLEELDLAKQKNFRQLTFGPRILRTETAPIVALSILQSKYGDL